MQIYNGSAHGAVLIAGYVLRCLFVLFLAFSADDVWACPRFVEFFPDPTDVPDQQGEFVEIRLEKNEVGNVFAPESISVLADGKKSLKVPYPRVERLVLVHDSAYCPKTGAACGLLGGISLPNSREISWVLEAGSCRDSVTLAVPKAGKSFQRVKFSDEWTLAEPSFGFGNPFYEEGVSDCGIERLDAEFLGKGAWSLRFVLSGCDSTWLKYDLLDLYSGRNRSDSVLVRRGFTLDSVAGEAIWIRGRVSPDEVAFNDSLDTLIFMPGKSPLVLSEIHHCPNEPEPEWVEVYNRSEALLPLDKIRFCDRGGPWSGFLESDESLVFTKDTAGLRNYLGFRDVKLFQTPLGYLNNSGGSLGICYGNQVLDSAYWDKTLVTCPSGLNPLTGRPENTPGYQGNRNETLRKKKFSYKISSRVVQKGRSSLLVLVECESQIPLKLLDSMGRVRWKTTVPANQSTWMKIPTDSLDVGVAYVSIAEGKAETLIGILVRP